MVVAGDTVSVPYDGNATLSVAHPSVRRAVVLIPGSNRNSTFGYQTLIEAATAAGVNDPSTLLLAPQFLTEEDISAFQLSAKHLFWSDEGWKQGSLSRSTLSHPRPVRISSFSVLDSILYRVASDNPNLESIVVAGHSAGGQFVNRFAAGSPLEQALSGGDVVGHPIQLSYIVANPSSYLYLSPERLLTGTTGTFAVPDSAPCLDYDHYKYGLLARNTYMSAVTDAQIIDQYAQRRVTYLLGALDNDPAHPELDTSCPAMLQGAHRLERGQTYHAYLRHFYGPSITAMHEALVVPGIAHDSRAMLTSVAGVSRLFGLTSSLPVGAEEGAPARSAVVLSEPNPFRSETTVSFALPVGSGPAKVGVYDIHGRLVREFRDIARNRARGAVVWDGRTSSGEDLPTGIYFVRLEGARTAVKTSVVLLR